MAISHNSSETRSDSSNDTVINRIRTIPEHFRGNVLARLYGSGGRIARAMKKVQNADILERASIARKQAWSLAHVSRGNVETDLLILDALLSAFYGCDCETQAKEEFREMLEESLNNGAAAEVGEGV